MRSANIDYAMLNKIYGNAPEGAEVRYSPAICMGAKRELISGKPDLNHVSTSYVERQNLTMRMSMRRLRGWRTTFKKARKSRTRDCDSLYVLQLRAYSPIPSRHSCNGSGNLGSCLVNRGDYWID